RISREEAATEAWTIVEAELAGFARDRASRTAVPAITALRRHFEMHRARVLIEAGGDAARATELLINRLLHDPSQALRRLAGAAKQEQVSLREMEHLLQELFGLGAEGEVVPSEQETKT